MQTQKAFCMRITERFGMTLLELIVCTVIIGILSATALPLAKNFVRNQKEEALKESLYELRRAIDRYYEKKSMLEPGLPDAEYYPESLKDLVDNRLLRRIPQDPFTLKPDWVTRSSTDEPRSDISDGRNVFDVFSASDELDRYSNPYSTW